MKKVMFVLLTAGCLPLVSCIEEIGFKTQELDGRINLPILDANDSVNSQQMDDSVNIDVELDSVAVIPKYKIESNRVKVQ
ncbi:MAG: hypothetical protein HOL28_05560 [Crocinitomicaceae bacterium]|jgi:hypothetical protein|nr:hypothetical protein [Crocinitomicaceae bacterium]MBT5402894.1 hypothetical protein [Crocinitomicaceae bacterium]MBT6514650.1 hypothetical protein [Crocinitomicaceae bacterium]